MRQEKTIVELYVELDKIYYRTPRIFFFWRKYLKGIIDALEYVQNLRDIDSRYL